MTEMETAQVAGKHLPSSFFPELMERGGRPLLEAIARGTPLAGALDVAARLVEDHAPDAACAVVLMSEADLQLGPVPSPSLPPALAAALESSSESAERDRLAAHGFGGCWSTPILSAGVPTGALIVYYRQARGPSASERAFVEAAACLVGIAVARERERRALAESEERYDLATRGANDGLWDWNLHTNQVLFSARWKAMLGFEPSEVGSSPQEWFDRVHPEDRDKLAQELEAHLAGRSDLFQHEHRMLLKDRSYRWMLSRGLALRDADGKPTRVAGSQTDIAQRKLAEERLLHDALHDTLTGLPNRALLMDLLRRSLGRAKRNSDYRFAVLFLDLDRFKFINDSLGHMVGDQLLMALARRLESCLRPGDTVARLGGDEFTVLLHNVRDVSDATRVAERIHRELSVPFALSGQEVFTSTSIGIALSSQRYEQPEEMLRDADTALYRAKARGRSRHEVFDQAMHARAVALLKLETDLRRAVEREEFRIFYQPIVALASLNIVGFEALIRWQRPQVGLVPPGEFIGAAEETGLIVPIGWRMLRESCRQMVSWQERFPSQPPLKISVNLSGRQFSQAELVEQVERILQETGLSPESLVLEVTESAVMENAEKAVARLSQLKSLGVALHLDDFGTGYSSLGYLHRFQIDTLKVDRTFVGNMRSGGANWVTVRTIVSLAHNLGMQVIAEGVETEEQLNELRSLGCQFAQGDYFSIPTSPERAEQILVAPAWQSRGR
jgi:diguanylate cyclase (GGDEF)-like protein/PAS domain S-box-containing protein